MAIWHNAFLIYNPSAGKLKGTSGRLLQRTIDALRTQGHTITAVPTHGQGTAGSIAAESVAGGADLIIAAGGDGTINEVANGLIGTNAPVESNTHVPIAILPGGTANVLSVELGLGTSMIRAAERLSDLVPERIAAGQLESASESRHFLLMAGAGFDAMIVYSLSAALKEKLGRAAYWVGGFQHLGRPLPQFHVRVNGNVSQCSFALATRVRNYGGDLTIAREASLFSKHFELVLFQGTSSLPYFRYLLGIVTGTLAQMPGVSIVRTDSASFESAGDSGVYIQIDGEIAGRLPATLRIVPDAITLLVPEAFRTRHQRNGHG
ncbi:MAG: diacylglycerol kinase family lipid kinase [Bryobacteraceae bacterium]|nr:diacylglycerol kinase family lipid kinase [Bryobacteraceae bacterium]